MTKNLEQITLLSSCTGYRVPINYSVIPGNKKDVKVAKIEASLDTKAF